MKTYIINLETSTRRRECVLDEVRRHGLDYELVAAVDGTRFSDEDLAQLPVADLVRDNSAYYSRTIIGAALSHAKVYERILESDVDVALVLEDDAVLADGIRDVLQSIRSKIGPNEIVVCHYMSVQPIRLSSSDVEPLVPGFDLHHPLSLTDINSGAGYVITRATAESLLRTVLPVQAEADSWKAFYEQGGFDSIRFVHPMPVSVRGDKSTIAGDRQSMFRRWLTTVCDDYRVPVIYPMLRAARLRSVSNRSHVVFADGSGSRATEDV